MRRPGAMTAGAVAFARLLAVALVLLAGVAASAPAMARDVTAADRDGIAQAVSRFDAAMRAKDIPNIIDVVPPRVTAHIAKTHGVPLTKLRQSVLKQTREVMEGAVLKSFSMDLAATRYAFTPGGSPYALIPTRTEMQVGEQKIDVASDTLAMTDKGRWYLLDLSNAGRVAIFTQVYPDFAGIELGSKTIKAAP